MEKIMLTGATGQLGTDVVNLLIKKVDPKNISALVRDISKAEKLKEKGITVFKGDYNDYDSLMNAFKGIDKLYFISGSDLTAREKQQENVVNAAIEAKVKHVIYTGFQRKNETSSSPIEFIAKAHLSTEKLLKSSGMNFTILNHGLYMEFLLGIFGEQFKKNHTIFFPAGNGKVAFTLRSDLAAGAVEILTTKGHENKVYNFFSEKNYSFSDIARILSQILGKEVSYVSPTREEYKMALSKAQMPEIYINLFGGFAEAIRQGEFDATDTILSNLLGRNCVTAEEFLKNVYQK